MSIRNRLLIVGALALASIYALFPRNVKERVQVNGVYQDTTIRQVPLKLGLDLSGGIHLALEVDESKGAVTDKAEAIDRALKVVRTRIDEFGVSEPVVQKVGDERIIVELPGLDDPARARSLVEKSAFLQFQITDETNALEKALPRIDNILRRSGTAAKKAPAASGDTAPNVLSNLFASSDSTARQGADTAGSDSSLYLGGEGAFSSLIQPGGIPGEYYTQTENVETLRRYLSMPEVQAALPPGKVVRFGSVDESNRDSPVRALYVLDERPIITGDFLIDAKPQTDPIQGNIVTFELNNQGGRRFGRETERHVGDYMAIVLDDIVQGQPPVIQSQITTRGQITMRGRPLQAAQDLALVLRAGALPVPLKVVESRRIGPSLGEDSIVDGKRAGYLGIALVILIMVVYYRFAGTLAVASLLLYGLFTLAILAGFNAVLTLPGLAGFVLSIGIAVDANVLIFERIREELDHGKSVRASIDEGFKHAMSAIIDSNVSTILTAAVLYQFGTGPVRGFAVTLIAGIVASMISAIFVVRTFFLLWLQRNRGAQTLSI